MRVSYVTPDDPGPDASAILAAEELLGGAPFLVHPADGILVAPLAPLVEELVVRRLDGLAVVALERRALRRGRMSSTMNGRPTGATPEPDAAPSLGPCVFSPAVFDSLRGPFPAGEGSLADVVACLRARSARVGERESEQWWRYDGCADSLLYGNRLVLDEVEAGDVPDGVVASEISGRVAIHPTALVRSSVVRGPAAIGAGAELRDAFVGPYTAVGDRVVVENAEIADSILLPGGVIRHMSERIERSVLGRDARLSRDFALPRAVRLVAGDGTEIAMT
jgi:glucose-1-phosphate thymidylyltransferase